MPLTPIAGAVRLRAFQLGKETTFKTEVAATRRMPWSIVMTVDPHWTFPTAETGTLDQAIAPYRTAIDITGQATGQLYSDDVPTLISAGIMGGLSFTTSGTSKTLTAAPASTSQDVFDTYTGEWLDDVSADGLTMTGGVIEQTVLSYPQDMGPITLAADWRFAKVASWDGSGTTAGLSVDLSPVPMFMADTELYLNDTAGAIETTKLSDILYDATVTITNNLDVKRFANGSNSRFEVISYSRGERVITLASTGAKQTAWLAEAAKWIGSAPTERFAGLRTTSVSTASVGISHSMDIRLPLFWMTRADQAISSNTAFQLTGHQVYDTTLGYPIRWTSTSTRAAL